MILKYFFYLFLIAFACEELHSSQASNDAARARVVQGVEYIRGQDAKRADLFKAVRGHADILSHTTNIYTLLKDSKKVSLIHGATLAEKETIFKAIMASAIIHAPEAGADYTGHLDFYEYKPELLEAIFAILNPHRVDIVKPESLAQALVAFFSKYNRNNVVGVKSADSYFCHIYDLFDERGQSLLPKLNSLVKHFEIIIALNRFTKAVVQSFKNGTELNDGQFANCEMLLNDSRMNVDMLFQCFSEVCNKYEIGYMTSHLDTIKGKYLKYLESNAKRGAEFSTHAVNQNECFSADIAGNKFEFLVHKVSGDGTCGYYSLGITREEFGKFLKDNLHNAEIKEKILIALNDGYAHYNLGPTGLTLDSDNTSYKKLIDTYYPNAARYLKTEEIELVSNSDIKSSGSDPGHYSIGKLKEIWNQKPLNQQVICVWTYASPGKLTFSGAYFQGKLIRKNDNGSMTLDPIGVRPIDFTEEFKRLMREGNIIHIYNNGYNHYDHLIATIIN